MYMRKGLCNSIAEPGWLQKKECFPSVCRNGFPSPPTFALWAILEESGVFKNKQYL